MLCIHSYGEPIYWRSMVQFLIALSTTESEYVVVVKATKEALWQSVG